MKQRVLITGASGGIGNAFAKIFAENGYDLILTARSEDKIFEMKGNLEEKYKIKVTMLPVDLTISHVAEEIFYELMKRNLDVDVLVNNAGVAEYGKFAETDWRREGQILQLNIVTLTHLTKLFLKRMLERKNGKILNVASVGAFQPGPMMSVFYATQAYILSFSEALACELKGTGISVTALCPGPTESGFQATAKMGGTRIIQDWKLPSAHEVALYGFNAMNQGKVVAVPGMLNSVLAQSSRFLPRRTLTNIVNYLHQKK